ncbi:uncharacterized protein B0H18DRAFT_619840 [Fomitopsis serialis]|uniref:uncharacterized protein n=1 Tax=Fomitopsis serialis TaxID=139415 RepID=UPI002007CD15|nr:uncharacterized protein B0H18DRAFT_619840 [Neoantrodia serialis]KAH9919913.1 hypothetical protein B0H18DRAFT_619840 [Neoantrodia serialis]
MRSSSRRRPRHTRASALDVATTPHHTACRHPPRRAREGVGLILAAVTSSSLLCWQSTASVRPVKFTRQRSPLCSVLSALGLPFGTRGVGSVLALVQDITTTTPPSANWYIAIRVLASFPTSLLLNVRQTILSWRRRTLSSELSEKVPSLNGCHVHLFGLRLRYECTC